MPRFVGTVSSTPACYDSFMVRPRWHDVVIVVAIVGLVGTGVWALWWDDVRDAVFGPNSAAQPPTMAAPSAPSI